LENGQKHVQIHYQFEKEYVQVSEIKKDVKAIDYVYDFRSQSKDFYAIQRDPVFNLFRIVEIKFPTSRKVQ
jgi:hypothetical protein